VLASSRLVASYWVLVLTALVGGVVAMALTLVSAEVYDAVTERDGIAGFDRPVLDAAIAVRNPTVDGAVTAFTNLGGPIGMSILATLVTLALALRWRSRTPVVLMVIAVAGALAMTRVGKLVVGRVRPPQSDAVPPFESSPSFPSGHALNSTVIAGLVAYLIARRLTSHRARLLAALLAAAWAVTMGLSRVYLGHHWLTDVIVGWTLALAWLALVATAHRLYLTVSRSRGEPDEVGTVTAYEGR